MRPSTLLTSGLIAIMGSAPVIAQGVGEGLYHHGGDVIEKRFGDSFGFDREFETELTNELVTRPTVVQGLFGTTIVTGNTIINRGNVAGYDANDPVEFVEVQCPTFGFGRVVIRNNRIINLGTISNYGGGGAATIAVECGPFGFRSTDITGNDVRNAGTLHSE